MPDRTCSSRTCCTVGNSTGGVGGAVSARHRVAPVRDAGATGGGVLAWHNCELGRRADHGFRRSRIYAKCVVATAITADVGDDSEVRRDLQLPGFECAGAKNELERPTPRLPHCSSAVRQLLRLLVVFVGCFQHVVVEFQDADPIRVHGLGEFRL